MSKRSRSNSFGIPGARGLTPKRVVGAISRGLGMAYGAKKVANNFQTKASRFPRIEPPPYNPRMRQGYMRSYTSGRYIGRFKKARKVSRKSQRGFKAGCVFKLENGGKITDPNCVYIGTSTYSAVFTVRNICRCIVKELWKQMDIPIENFANEATTTAGSINVSYYTSHTSTSITTAGTAVTIGDSYEVISGGLQALMDAIFGEAKSERTLYEIRYNRTLATITDKIPNIRGSNFYFKDVSTATIELQNETLAASLAENSNRNSVTNNPLQGRTYLRNGATGFLPKMRADITKAFITSDNGSTTGILAVSAAENTESVTRKPVPPSFFQSKIKSSKVMLQPGQIKKYTIKHTISYPLDKFLNKHHSAIDRTTEMNYLGKTIMIGLEKQLNNRDELNEISVGYEVNARYVTTYKYSPKIWTAPFIAELTGPV